MRGACFISETKHDVCNWLSVFYELLANKSAVSITAVTITNSRNRTLLTATPNEFPATRYSVKRDLGDDCLIDFILVCARIFHQLNLLC